MIRTQVYLNDDVYTQIQVQAQAQNQPAAALIRQYLALGIKKSVKRETARAAFLKLAKIGKGVKKGPADLALNLDDYLYGDKR